MYYVLNMLYRHCFTLTNHGKSTIIACWLSVMSPDVPYTLTGKEFSSRGLQVYTPWDLEYLCGPIRSQYICYNYDLMIINLHKLGENQIKAVRTLVYNMTNIERSVLAILQQA